MWWACLFGYFMTSVVCFFVEMPWWYFFAPAPVLYRQFCNSPVIFLSSRWRWFQHILMPAIRYDKMPLVEMMVVWCFKLTLWFILWFVSYPSFAIIGFDMSKRYKLPEQVQNMEVFARCTLYIMCFAFWTFLVWGKFE